MIDCLMRFILYASLRLDDELFDELSADCADEPSNGALDIKLMRLEFFDWLRSRLQ